MGSLSGNQVTALLGLGADAMDNMFDIQIVPPDGLKVFDSLGTGRGGFMGPEESTFLNDITIRADGFSPPAFNPKTYKVAYKAVSIDRPATKIEGERQFTITFRLDANYRAYRFLSAWKSIIMQASNGYATNALWDNSLGDANGLDAINKVFGKVSVTALSRPIYQTSGTPFSAQGVSAGKFTEDSLVSAGAVDVADTDKTIWNFRQVWVSKLDEPKYKTDGGDIIKVEATFKFGDYDDPTYYQYASVVPTV